MTEKKDTLIELNIGITDYCNYRCIMCMQTAHNGIYGNPDVKVSPLHENEKGYMDVELFNKIVDDLSIMSIKLNTISLHWLGESMMHPGFFDMFSKIIEENEKNKFFNELILFTNCYFLDDLSIEKMSQVLKNNKNTRFTIVFSLDSASENSYEYIHKAGDYSTVIKNVKSFRTKTFENKNVFRIYRFLVMPENYREAEIFLDLWKKECENRVQITWNEEKNFERQGENDIINFKRVYSDDLESMQKLHYQVVKLLHGEDTYFHSGKKADRPPCAAPFRTPVVNWDGRLTVCCPDDRLELCLGNLKDNTFYQLWFGEKAQDMRRDILSREFYKYDRCSRCGNYAGFPLKESEISLYGL